MASPPWGTSPAARRRDSAHWSSGEGSTTPANMHGAESPAPRAVETSAQRHRRLRGDVPDDVARAPALRSRWDVDPQLNAPFGIDPAEPGAYRSRERAFALARQHGTNSGAGVGADAADMDEVAALAQPVGDEARVAAKAARGRQRKADRTAFVCNVQLAGTPEGKAVIRCVTRRNNPHHCLTALIHAWWLAVAFSQSTGAPRSSTGIGMVPAEAAAGGRGEGARPADCAGSLRGHGPARRGAQDCTQETCDPAAA